MFTIGLNLIEQLQQIIKTSLKQNTRRRQILIDEAAGIEMVLPVTPTSYSWINGIHVNVVTVEGLGDLHFPGYKALETRPIDCMFPAHAYPFNEPGTNLNPFYYVEQLEKWCQSRKILRYIVRPFLNACVIIESVKYGEQDGTNDVYATITVRQYQPLDKLSQGTKPAAKRSTDTAAVAATSYQVKKGDTLSAIARKYYGDAGLYKKLASYNGIKNANLIFPGQRIKIPPLSAIKR